MPSSCRQLLLTRAFKNGGRPTRAELLERAVQAGKIILLTPGNLKMPLKSHPEIKSLNGAYKAFRFNGLSTYFAMGREIDALAGRRNCAIDTRVASNRKIIPRAEYEVGDDVEKLAALILKFRNVLRNKSNTTHSEAPRLLAFQRDEKVKKRDGYNDSVIYASPEIVLPEIDGLPPARAIMELTTDNKGVQELLKRKRDGAHAVYLIARPSLSYDDFNWSIKDRAGILTLRLDASRDAYCAPLLASPLWGRGIYERPPALAIK